MNFYSLLNSVYVFTPLEQFDEVIWLSNNFFDSLSFFNISSITEFSASEIVTREDANTLLRNNPVDGNINDTIIFVLGFAIRSIRFRISAFSNIANQAYNIIPSYITESFSYSPIALFAIIHLFTGTVFTLWFADFFSAYIETNQALDYIYTEKVARRTGTEIHYSFVFNPQIDFSFGIDERRITFFLAFLLIGGGESEDDEDFLLTPEADLEIVESIVAPLFVANLGKDIQENGSLYLKVCAIFSFVLFSNLRGRIPYGDTATSSLILTFWVAFAVFGSIITLRIRKHGVNYLFSLFRPSGCPLPLIFLLIPIEFLSYSFRVVSLSVRLFANRRAGHTLRKVLIGFSYVRFTLGEGYAIAAFLPALVVFVLIFLERAVAGIQAYIFTILMCIYLKDLYVAH